MTKRWGSQRQTDGWTDNRVTVEISQYRLLWRVCVPFAHTLSFNGQTKKLLRRLVSFTSVRPAATSWLDNSESLGNFQRDSELRRSSISDIIMSTSLSRRCETLVRISSVALWEGTAAFELSQTEAASEKVETVVSEITLHCKNYKFRKRKVKTAKWNGGSLVTAQILSSSRCFFSSHLNVLWYRFSVPIKNSVFHSSRWE